MIDYKKALSNLKKNKIKINSEIILSENSINRVTTSNIYASNNFPSANNTAFDGFAVNSKETEKLNKNNSKKFRIVKVLAAGDNPKIKKIYKYSAVEVMTGAIVQKPFDTVIPIEQIKFYPNKSQPKYIVINKKVKKYDYIRFVGSDFKKGKKIINKGEIIRAKHILAFKTLGIKKILVKKKVSIVFYTTGNEISNKEVIPNWKIRNSNSYYIKSLLKSLPILFKEKKILRDYQIEKFKKEISKNLKSNNEIIITSGALSAGKFDFVPDVIKKFKLKYFFKGASIRPGKPVMFAKFKDKNKAFFGLPGNPISSAACFRFFVLPYIFFSSEIYNLQPLRAKLKSSFIKNKNFTRFIKGKLNINKKGVVEFEILKGQESFRINPFLKSNCWGVFPSGISTFNKGTIISCYSSLPLEELLTN